MEKIYHGESIAPRPAGRETGGETGAGRDRSRRAPKEITLIRSMENWGISSGESWALTFIKQARIMADYVDDFPWTRPGIYFYPTYQSLSDAELRGYFTWRGQVRRGAAAEFSSTYAYLYIYELLNLIGCEGPEDGFLKLTGFRERYGKMNRALTHSLDRWIVDFAVYYGLEGREEVRDLPLLKQDRDYEVMIGLRDREDQAVIQAVKRLSTYKLERSSLYQEKGALFDRAAVQVLRRVEEHYRTRTSHSWVYQYFGSERQTAVELFQGAVFYFSPKEPADRVVALGPRRTYRLSGNQCLLTAFFPSSSKRGKLGKLLKAVDAAIREETGFGQRILAPPVPQWLEKAIREEVRAAVLEEARQEARRFHLDLSRVNGIRADADYTMGRLITEEEAWEGPAKDQEAVRADRAAGPSDGPAEGMGSPAAGPGGPEAGRTEAERADGGDPAVCLGEDERRYLLCLLKGGDTGWVHGRGLLPEVLEDSINEALFDLFGDIVLDGGAVIEDYREELSERMGAEEA